MAEEIEGGAQPQAAALAAPSVFRDGARTAAIPPIKPGGNPAAHPTPSAEPAGQPPRRRGNWASDLRDAFMGPDVLGPEVIGEMLPPAEAAAKVAERRALAEGLAEFSFKRMGPHRFADPKLMALAREEISDVYDENVRQAMVEARETMDAAMSVCLDGAWPTLDDCIPPGSLLAEIDQAFLDTTDIPRELPVFAAIHYVSALLLQRGARISIVGQLWRPDIWTICTAASGSGKTFASSNVAKALGGDVALFPDSSSSAKFIEDLAACNGGLWMRDEFAQFLKALGQDSNGDTKDYLLRCYDGSPITRSTKTETIEVKDPALTIFGSTVFETIKDYLTREMLLDGFAPRFSFVVAERDPARTPRALYKVASRLPAISASWSAIVGSGLRPVYEVGAVAEESFQRSFEILLTRADTVGVDQGYLRRLTHRGVKYALIYHVLLGKTEEWLDEEDFEYAAKLCALNLRDLRKVLDLYPQAGRGGSAGEPDDEKASKVAEKLREHLGFRAPPLTPRELQAKTRALRGMTSSGVRDLLKRVVEAEPELAAAVNLDPPKQPFAGQAGRPSNK